MKLYHKVVIVILYPIVLYWDWKEKRERKQPEPLETYLDQMDYVQLSQLGGLHGKTQEGEEDNSPSHPTS